jgi:hypothetical protein
MDCKLDFPPSSHVYLVFHVSYSNKLISENILVQTIFLDINEEGKKILEPKLAIEISINYIIEKLLSTSSSGKINQ